MARDVRDFYPTPPDAVLGLAHAIKDHGLIPRERMDGLWFEPSCGRGSILRWFGVPSHRWLACEMDPGLAAVSEPYTQGIAVGDALAMDWPAGRSVCDNPPFSLLEPFVRKALSHMNGNESVIMLTRSQWFDEPPRRWLRTLTTRPDYEVKLCWRVSFNDRGVDFATYSWWIWNTLRAKDNTVKIWVERPKICAKYWDEFRASVLGEGGPSQGELGLE